MIPEKCECGCDYPDHFGKRPASPPAAEFQVTLDRRELAAIRAGLRLLEWFAGPDTRVLPYHLVREVVDISEGPDLLEPLSDAELRELARRLGS